MFGFALLLSWWSRTLRLSLLGSWLNLVLLMLSFAKPGCLFFCRSCHPVVTASDIEEVLSGTGGDQLHVYVADVIKSFDTVDRSILDCALGRLGFRKVYFSFHSQVRLRFKLAAGLGESWCGNGGIHQGCHLSIFFLKKCGSLCPLVSSS